MASQGFSQKPGMDYMDTGTFAPVMHFETLRTMLALATINRMCGKWNLNGWLKEEIYMKQPSVYDNGSGCVCHLIKTLYGHKQARNEWNNKFDDTMKDLCYANTCSKYCCYVRQQGGELCNGSGKIAVIRNWHLYVSTYISVRVRV
jgi:Reverse transcriptase (RNA-dependent DNA polymerase)